VKTLPGIVEPVQLPHSVAAAFLAVSPRTLDMLVRRGDISPVKIPGFRRLAFRVDELRDLADRWAALRPTQGTAA
jgi:hypothetical protein